MNGQELRASFEQGWPEALGFPMLRVDGDLVLSLEAALATYEVIEASAEEREVLQRWGHAFGGLQ